MPDAIYFIYFMPDAIYFPYILWFFQFVLEKLFHVQNNMPVIELVKQLLKRVKHIVW